MSNVCDIRQQLKNKIVNNINDRCEKESLNIRDIFTEKGDKQLRHMYSLYRWCEIEKLKA